jgi:small subunit ribosomal protein S3
MGQIVNPVGLRLGINRGWDSIWFAKKREYGNLLIEDYKIREYIKTNVVNSGVSQVIIERTSKKCIVSIHTSRPGFVIGKKGSDVEKIKKNLSKITSSEVSLNIKEVKLTSLLVIFDRFFLIFSTSDPFLPITKPGLDV